MATDPVFASTPVIGAALPTTADTSLSSPTNQVTVVTGASTGTKIEAIVVQAIGTTVAGMLNLFLHDGSSYHLYDQFLITAVTSSATAAAFRDWRLYDMLILPSSSWTLRASQTIAGNASILKVIAHGGSF